MGLFYEERRRYLDGNSMYEPTLSLIIRQVYEEQETTKRKYEDNSNNINLSVNVLGRHVRQAPDLTGVLVQRALVKLKLRLYSQVCDEPETTQQNTTPDPGFFFRIVTPFFFHHERWKGESSVKRTKQQTDARNHHHFYPHVHMHHHLAQSRGRADGLSLVYAYARACVCA